MKTHPTLTAALGLLTLNSSVLAQQPTPAADTQPAATLPAPSIEFNT